MKDKIIYFIKLFLLIYPAVNGYAFAYLLMWYAIGLQLELWSACLLVGLAAVSEYAYLQWVRVD